jgi:hypothetical protein
MEFTEEQIISKRENIKKMLHDTYPIDYSGVPESSCVLRYYRMTESEFKDAINYTLTVWLGDPTTSGSCEGFCYDIRQLLKERYIVLDGRTAQVPIPLSPERWNWLLENVNNQQLALYTTNKGILDYPLLKEELIVIFKNIKNQATVCSMYDRCIATSPDVVESRSQIQKYYDGQERFGPDVAPTKPFTFSKSVQKLSKREEQQKITHTISLVEKELRDLDVWVQSIEELTYSDETKNYIRNLLNSGTTEEQIASFLIYDVLSSVIK